MTNFATEILTISKNTGMLEDVFAILNSSSIQNTSYKYENEDETLDFVKENSPSILILDDKTEAPAILAKKVKSEFEDNIFIILLCDTENFDVKNGDFSGSVDSFVQKPIQKNILISTINSFLKIKKSLDKFKKDNKELNKSLYQLDVLYNTSSKLSGNLDKKKLYEIMFETLEKTLSFDLACALIFPQAYENSENKLFIHSLKKPDETLLNVLSEKITDYAKENAQNNDFTKVSIEEFIKPSYENQNFDIKLLNFDKLMAPIQVKDKTYGMLLIYRNKLFLKEDVVCFQSIVHQISSALQAIILYDEIKNTNVELKKLERIKSEFVSIVSHELRTPLTPINNSLEIVLSENITDTARNFTNMAKRNVKRLSGIIEDLLDLSRIETGKFDFKYEKYNIKTSFDIIQKTFEEQAKEKGIIFETELNSNLPDIYADSRKIEQILTNLTTNAIKFTPNGGSVKISAQTINAKNLNKDTLINPVCDFSGDYLKISVKDTGIGIKEEDIHKIFDKFSQIENSLTRNAGGVGLGLTITKHFTDAHLGGIWVNSTENEGSDFNVIFPVYSDLKAFEINLNAARKINETTCLLTLKSKEGRQKLDTLIQKLKEENIIKQLKNSKEISFETENYYAYKIFFSNLQKNVCDFMTRQIQDYINKESIFKDCGIVLERAVFKKEDGDYSQGI
ncbi:MAG: HAMP domain-containing sensor histidine kinase [Candidatus Gastranaerophilales bacterium]|nr:HAMP domain-containing sensor histidine kinase [Candidatus Gastranaerophilales bacterium]